MTINNLIIQKKALSGFKTLKELINRYEKMEGENHPISLILCTQASSEQIELLEMHKDGIMVAEYWTELPPKEQLEQKIKEALASARERLARKNLLE